MDENKLRERALLAFPHKKRNVREYFGLFDWVKHYEKLMENPDSPWVCSGYNNAVANMEDFRRKNPDIAEWFEQRRRQAAEGEENPAAFKFQLFS